MEKKIKFIPQTEIEKEEIINISSKGKIEAERILSNFAHTPFDLDGKHYESTEGFWQSIKFPEGSKKREKIANLFGSEAKKAGKKIEGIDELEYSGEKIKVGSTEHHELMKKAIKAKIEQNSHILQLLINTGEKEITHIFKTPEGKILPDSKALPGKIFSQILMDLRKEFQKKIIRTKIIF